MSYTEGVGNLRQASSIPAAKAAQQTPAAKADAKPGAVSGTSQSDRAELSSEASIVSKALEHSDVRMDKVNALRLAIASGSYHVSSAEVADKLIESMKG